MHLPEVFGQLCYKIWLLFLHVLQNSVVSVADFYTCGREKRFINSNEHKYAQSCSFFLYSAIFLAAYVNYPLLLFIAELQ